MMHGQKNIKFVEHSFKKLQETMPLPVVHS